MKNNYGTFSISGLLFVTAAALTYAQYPDSVKFMTYNINAESHGSGSYSDIAAVINEIDPTINGIQKLDSCNSRNSSYVLEYLGEQTNMFYTFAAAQINYQGGSGSYGIGFLSDETPLNVRRLQIPKGSASEARAALEIDITMANQPVRVVVTHLDNANATNRTSQLQQIMAGIDSAGTAADPIIIMADFNAKSTESSMNVLTDAGFVFVKGANGEILDTAQKINHILYRPESRWSLLDVGNPAYSASNRYPLWALLKLLDTTTTVTIHPKASVNAMRNYMRISGQFIELELSRTATVSLEIFNPAGKKITSITSKKVLNAGKYTFRIPDNRAIQGIVIIAAKINNSVLISKKILSH
jgi:endonuclease/exonuclease/phosphatase family metal-dependent hydrolase